MNLKLGRNKDRLKIEKICTENDVLTSELEIANSFNEFFSLVGKKMSDAISNTNYDRLIV